MLDTKTALTNDTNQLIFFDFDFKHFAENHLNEAVASIVCLLQSKPKLPIRCNVGFSVNSNKEHYQSNLHHSNFVIVKARDYQRGLAVQTVTLDLLHYNVEDTEHIQQLAQQIIIKYIAWVKRRITRMKNAAHNLQFDVLISSIVPKAFRGKRKVYVMSGVRIDDVFTRSSLINLIVNNLTEYEKCSHNLAIQYNQRVIQYHLHLLLDDSNLRQQFINSILASDNLDHWLHDSKILTLLIEALSDSVYTANSDAQLLYKMILLNVQSLTKQSFANIDDVRIALNDNHDLLLT